MKSSVASEKGISGHILFEMLGNYTTPEAGMQVYKYSWKNARICGTMLFASKSI